MGRDRARGQAAEAVKQLTERPSAGHVVIEAVRRGERLMISINDDRDIS
jgi:hypothetical protein